MSPDPSNLWRDLLALCMMVQCKLGILRVL